jgi:thiamine-phosphate pyrophosphorylase
LVAAKRSLPESPFLYPIIDTSFSQHPLRDAEALIKAGVSILQFRAKAETRRTVFDITNELAQLCSEKNVLLILNDFVDVSLITDVAGVHLGQDDFPVEDARSLLPQHLIGLSTHNADQFQLANHLPVDYIAIGPVYETSTKRSINPHLGLAEIIPLLESKAKRLVAIGGIRLENIQDLVSTGIDGIALISELYRHGPVYDTARRLIDIMHGDSPSK